ncbi:MAG TPA: hypothetical protein VEU47_19120 [Candidatus Cybelea sp.]|nr:hypothetical protein [Candidatus Cybelea sp.]
MANLKSEPVKLVTKDEVLADKVQQGIVRNLEELLADAKNGDYEWMVVIARRNDGRWEDLTSGTADMGKAIGWLEMTKLKWIERYLNEHADK